MQCGAVWVNDHLPVPSEMPHGGVKGSGYGKDLSHYALEEYTVPRHVCFDMTDAVRKPWHAAVLGEAA
jgi:betaine-aldehyde dehydrogenase